LGLLSDEQCQLQIVESQGVVVQPIDVCKEANVLNSAFYLLCILAYTKSEFNTAESVQRSAHYVGQQSDSSRHQDLMVSCTHEP